MSQSTAIIEIRAAAGGEEAKIWAADLLRMYVKYAEKQGWTAKQLGSGKVKIKGEKAFDLLEKEAGVHRVQRIPKTERHGRIHTSTATVAILPDSHSRDVFLNYGDLEWQFFRASTQGGQNVQKVSTAVRLKHKPSGLVVTCEQERSQEQNRKVALELLKTRLWEKQEKKRRSELDDTRREAVGRGMRSEKIRTYNYPQNRVTDHRLGKSFYNLDAIMGGNLKKIIQGFQKKEA